jgi:hypothetical protein
MKFVILAFLIFVLFLLPCAAQTNKKENNRFGTVQAFSPSIAFDEKNDKDSAKNGQTIYVYLQANSFVQEMKYKGKGLFETSVPQGVYQITLKNLNNEPIGYFRLAKFFVSSNKTTRLSLPPIDEELCDEEYGFILWMSHSHLPSPIYDQFIIKKPFDLIVRYCQKQVVGQTIHYKFARLSYKNLTIYADKINFGKRNHSLEVFGNKDEAAFIEMGNCSMETEKMKINLNKLSNPNFLCKQSQNKMSHL